MSGGNVVRSWTARWSLIRALSWLESISASLLAAFGGWLLFDIETAPRGADPHGYVAMGAIAALCLGAALALAGGTLRATSMWRWLGHIPLLVLLIAMYTFN